MKIKILVTNKVKTIGFNSEKITREMSTIMVNPQFIKSLDFSRIKVIAAHEMHHVNNLLDCFDQAQYNYHVDDLAYRLQLVQKNPNVKSEKTWDDCRDANLDFKCPYGDTE